MHVIAIVWTYAILSLPQAQSVQKYTTSADLVNIAKNILKECVARSDNPQLLNSVQLGQEGIVTGETDYVSLVQSVANRLVTNTGRKTNWKKKEIKKGSTDYQYVDVEVYAVLTFTFMIFKTLRVDRKEVMKMRKEGADTDENFALKFFEQKKKLIQEKLANVGRAEDRVVLDVGYGVRMKRPMALDIISDTLVDACFVFYTTDDLLAEVVVKIPGGGGFLHPKTTLYLANHVLSLQQNVKKVLFENTTRAFRKYKSVLYQVTRDGSRKPCKINLVVKDQIVEPLVGNTEPFDVRWDLLEQPNRRYASYGFGTWTKNGTEFLQIISVTHKLVNEHREMPKTKKGFLTEMNGKQPPPGPSVATVEGVSESPTLTSTVACVHVSPTPTDGRQHRSTASVTVSELTAAEPANAPALRAAEPATAPALMAATPVTAPALMGAPAPVSSMTLVEEPAAAAFSSAKPNLAPHDEAEYTQPVGKRPRKKKGRKAATVPVEKPGELNSQASSMLLNQTGKIEENQNAAEIGNK